MIVMSHEVCSNSTSVLCEVEYACVNCSINMFEYAIWFYGLNIILSFNQLTLLVEGAMTPRTSSCLPIGRELVTQRPLNTAVSAAPLQLFTYPHSKLNFAYKTTKWNLPLKPL
ncbi:hypothetical protein TNCV_2335391 [Trichonephila clavipes]|uniref:Uncharacterized protein n=1 Tax=Trichonephila clavipes TaxID=2585209 RepID=A0A8X6SL29_TRICX|nr:hypothetical protein TNCV_2335391 [Trichonephila clavipes]